MAVGRYFVVLIRAGPGWCGGTPGRPELGHAGVVAGPGRRDLRMVRRPDFGRTQGHGMLDAGYRVRGGRISRDWSAAVRAGSIGSAVAIHSEPACGRHV